MSYELLILAFIMLIFCFLMQYFTVKVLFSLFNSVKPEGIRPVRLESPKKSVKKVQAENRSQEQFETIMRNIDAYDGTEIGQEEVK